MKSLVALYEKGSRTDWGYKLVSRIGASNYDINLVQSGIDEERGSKSSLTCGVYVQEAINKTLGFHQFKEI